MQSHKHHGEMKYSNMLKHKSKVRSMFHDIRVGDMECISAPSSKIVDSIPQRDQYQWTWCDWKYDGPPSAKRKHKCRNKGSAKAKTRGGWIGGYRIKDSSCHWITYYSVQEIRYHNEL